MNITYSIATDLYFSWLLYEILVYRKCTTVEPIQAHLFLKQPAYLAPSSTKALQPSSAEKSFLYEGHVKA